MKNLYLIFVLIVCSNSFVVAQFGFNKLYDFDLAGTEGTSVLQHEGKIYVLGESFATEPYTAMGVNIGVLDLKGNTLNKYYFESEDSLMFTGLCSDLTLRENKIISLLNINGVTRLWQFDLITQVYKTIKQIESPSALGGISGSTFDYKDEENYIIGATYYDGSKTNIYIYKKNNFEIQEIELMQSTSMSLRYLQEHTNGNIIVIGSLLNNQLPPDQFFYSKTYVCLLDNNGEILFEYTTPSTLSFGVVYDAIVKDNNSLVISGLEVRGLNEKHVSKPVVFELNSNNEIQWVSKIGSYEWDEDFWNKYSRILLTQEGDGYMLAGQGYVNNIDTSYFYGSLTKISLEGDSIWSKKYSVVPGRYWMYDAEKTEDGGYICSGSAIIFNSPQDSSWLQTWVMKTDTDGNIIPDTTSSLSSIDPFLNQIKVFPNPASDMLYVEHKSIKDLYYSLSNQQGQQVKEFDAPFDHHTYMLPISDLENGMYYLTVMSEGKVLKTTPIVVSR